ncbi:hypothetical protein O181_068263 [Austropuccinia psidii MF-1]|uniref:Uncharacterized protein n=1 Tax=Austropuccinia psidii MF-1 TaxID=1389203 RepID=A0A9Q3I598_9BASI|nr:hypothetical protein [Austropuccinia psidii MF-1]
MLTHPHPPPDETLTPPPHLRAHHSLRFRTHTSSSAWLTILTLLRGPHPPLHLLLSTAYHPYACGCFPNMPPMLLTILILAVPSQHASNAPSHWPNPQGYL